MPKRIKKPEVIIPEPPASLDKSEALTRDDAPIAFEREACLICGATRTADTCPVDGFRFTQETA